MKRYSEDGENLIEEVAKSFPTLKKVLIDDRNVFMANKLRLLEEKYGTVLALVGDGHVPGMSEILKDIELKVIRIDEVRNWKPKENDVASVSYSFNV